MAIGQAGHTYWHDVFYRVQCLQPDCLADRPSWYHGGSGASGGSPTTLDSRAGNVATVRNNLGCQANDVVLILDEVQSGYGRSGKFFAFQHHGINPDIVTTAKGMGNGFPIGGVLISPKFQASYGLLGTTFGGSHLACAAGIAVLDVMEAKNLIENTNKVSEYFFEAIKVIPEIIKVKGRGLMLGVEFDFDVSALRKKMIIEKYIFTGGANNKNLLRILPPLTITTDAIDNFIKALQESLAELNQ